VRGVPFEVLKGGRPASRGPRSRTASDPDQGDEDDEEPDDEARDRLQSHFSPERENVAFYFVIDDSGSHVWVQWDGYPEPTMTVVNLGNISLALECFSADADLIYIIVGDDGLALQIGLIPQRDPERLTILYP